MAALNSVDHANNVPTDLGGGSLEISVIHATKLPDGGREGRGLCINFGKTDGPLEGIQDVPSQPCSAQQKQTQHGIAMRHRRTPQCGEIHPLQLPFQRESAERQFPFCTIEPNLGVITVPTRA